MRKYWKPSPCWAALLVYSPSQRRPSHWLLRTPRRQNAFLVAASLAAARRLRERGLLQRDDVVVCNITGHGLKQPSSVRFSEEELRPIDPTLTALRQHLGEFEA